MFQNISKIPNVFVVRQRWCCCIYISDSDEAEREREREKTSWIYDVVNSVLWLWDVFSAAVDYVLSCKYVKYFVVNQLKWMKLES